VPPQGWRAHGATAVCQGGVPNAACAGGHFRGGLRFAVVRGAAWLCDVLFLRRMSLIWSCWVEFSFWEGKALGGECFMLLGLRSPSSTGGFVQELKEHESLRHCVTVSLYHCVTVSLCHCVTVSLCHCVTVSLCHCVTVSLCHCVLVPLCRRRWWPCSMTLSLSPF